MTKLDYFGDDISINLCLVFMVGV